MTDVDLQPRADFASSRWAERWRTSRARPYAVSLAADRGLRLGGRMNGAEGATIGLFAFACIGAAYVAQRILVPMLLAWVVATVLMPAHRWLQRRGVPAGASALLIGGVMMALVATLIFLFTMPLTNWIGRAGELSVLLKEKLRMLTQPLAMMEEFRRGLSAGGAPATNQVEVSEGNASLVTSILAVLTPAVSQFIIFFGTLIFYLIYRRDIGKAAVKTVDDRYTKWGIRSLIDDVENNMTIYFGTVALVNVCLGCIAALLAAVAGLPNPLMFGVLAMVVNFIPYVGDIIILSAFFVTGLLTFETIPQALVLPVVYILISTIEGHFVTPSIVGYRLTLNPFAVFLSIAFWTWLWGPAGAFLAVPIFLVASVIARHVEPQAEPVANRGPEPNSAPI
jgi:predicted PurR-regulated permease PerM